MIDELLGFMEEQLGGRRMDERQEEEEMQVGLEAAGVNGDQEDEKEEQEGPAPELVHHEQERHEARRGGGRCGGGGRGAGQLGLEQYIAQSGAAVCGRGQRGAGHELRVPEVGVRGENRPHAGRGVCSHGRRPKHAGQQSGEYRNIYNNCDAIFVLNPLCICRCNFQSYSF